MRNKRKGKETLLSRGYESQWYTRQCRAGAKNIIHTVYSLSTSPNPHQLPSLFNICYRPPYFQISLIKLFHFFIIDPLTCLPLILSHPIHSVHFCSMDLAPSSLSSLKQVRSLKLQMSLSYFVYSIMACITRCRCLTLCTLLWLVSLPLFIYLIISECLLCFALSRLITFSLALSNLI